MLVDVRELDDDVEDDVVVEDVVDEVEDVVVNVGALNACKNVSNANCDSFNSQ